MLNELWLYLLATVTTWFGFALAVLALVDLIARGRGRDIPHFSAKVRIAVGVMLFMCAQFVVWREEHKRANQEAANKAEFQGQVQRLQGELNGKNETISTLRDHLASRPPQVRIIPSQAVEPPKSRTGLRFFTKPIASNRNDAPYAVRVSIQPNGVISPVMFEVECDEPLRSADAGIMGYGVTYSRSDPVKGKKIFRFAIESVQSVDPSNIVLVDLYSDRPINVKNVRILNTF